MWKYIKPSNRPACQMSRNLEIYSLIKKDKLTLRSVGSMHNLSFERVRQICAKIDRLIKTGRVIQE